jgi:hypothetical protein
MRAGWIAWSAGAAGLLLAALGWVEAPRDFFAAWLAGFLILAAWPLGSLALLLAHAMTGGSWGAALRLPLLGGVSLMPLLVPAAIPLIFGLSTLYPWVRAAHGFYLQGGFFALRVTFYAAIWLGLAILSLRGRIGRFAPLAAMLLAYSVTFAVIDLAQSLTPGFNSSVFGLLAMAGMAGFGLAASLAAAIITKTPLPPAAPRLLFGLVILWAYLEFMQGLIVWESDLATETPWYIVRTTGGWGSLAWILAIGHFVLPFFLLMSGRLQRQANVMLAVALLLLAMEMLRWWWVVLPSLALQPSWIDLAVLVGLGGTAIGLVTTTRRRLQHG